MMIRIGSSALMAASLIAGSTAFVTPTRVSPASQSMVLSAETTGFEQRPRRPIKDISYGEGSRKFRRTVYSHDDWKKHRSPDRFSYYISAFLNSGIYKNIQNEITAVTAIAALVCIYNAVFGGYTDFAGVDHPALLSSPYLVRVGLPMATFTLANSFLGLLLVFRTNQSYRRWDEARKNWGMNINHTRDLVRMANTFYDSTDVSPQERQADLDHVALCTWAFVRAMKRHLSPEEEDEKDFELELLEKLPREQAQGIIDAAHRPNRALQDLSYAIDNLPMHFLRKNEIHAACTIFEDNLGSSERLLTSPVPLFYSRHTARFLSVWLLFLPFGLYDSFAQTWNHIGMVPAAALLSVFMFGIEELATQLEEPFTILPMQAFCDKIYNWCTEIVSWSPGDNGFVPKPTLPEHAFFTGTADAMADPLAYTVPAAPYVPRPAEPAAEYAPPPAEYAPAAQAPPAPVASPSANPRQLSFEEFLKQQGQQ